MIYRAIGVMSGSSLDGLDIAFTEFSETGGKWTYRIMAATCTPYPEEWKNKLQHCTNLSALEYLLLHAEYGHYIGLQVNHFIEKNNLYHKVNLIASHGHTSFHMPAQKMTAQLGDGAAIAAVTGLTVINDLRAADVALGGQGAPIVPIGEKLLFDQYDYMLNIGGIANISVKQPDGYTAFDICPANRVLNMLAAEAGMDYDEDGKLAAAGNINDALLNNLNNLEYYRLPAPKSLANSFGTGTVYTMIKKAGISLPDALSTYVEHIAVQIRNSIAGDNKGAAVSLLITGGGAFNKFLVERISAQLSDYDIRVIIPDTETVLYKEAMIMSLIGILRWREEINVLSSVTGAARNSIGGAMWMGGA